MIWIVNVDNGKRNFRLVFYFGVLFYAAHTINGTNMENGKSWKLKIQKMHAQTHSYSHSICRTHSKSNRRMRSKSEGVDSILSTFSLYIYTLKSQAHEPHSFLYMTCSLKLMCGHLVCSFYSIFCGLSCFS